ncbi:MAG: lipopolysaccharide heptosyltransferase I [Rhodocyclaceae bacterium]|nr:lipopolysaccharide heptosyltransferase I [Rhodocyclaceae bacterium]
MRLLLVKTSSLGDVIHNLPVASDIRRRFPGAQIDWVVEEGFAEIPRLHPAVGGVIPVAVRRWRKAPLSAATWREIMAYRRAVCRPASAELTAYDAVIDAQGLVKSALLTALASGKKFGFAAPREGLAALAYDVAVDVPRGLHAVTRNRLLAAGALGYSLADLPLDYGISAPPLKAGWLKVGAYAVLLTATSRADKEWPESDWRTLGAALNARGLACVLPGGSEAERTRAGRIARQLERGIAAPAMNLTELVGLLAGAKLVIGVDTGLVHLAAALGRPTVAIYCASDPALTGVLGRAPHVNLGATGQPPAAREVVDAALGLLSR